MLLCKVGGSDAFYHQLLGVVGDMGLAGQGGAGHGAVFSGAVVLAGPVPGTEFLTDWGRVARLAAAASVGI